MQTAQLEKTARYLRRLILESTAAAGSGHPSSSCSAVELMVGLMFGGSFRFDVNRPEHPNNDRLVFSKGHAAPLLYALWVAAGKVTEAELMNLRTFDSPLEGHPRRNFRYAEAATGSLGQGLSVGVGMALNAKYLDFLPYRTYVLIGDSEMTEGSQWEALQIAAHYRLDNLVGILDVNRLGQRGETLFGHNLQAYEKRISAFGWETFCIDGHAIGEVLTAFRNAAEVRGKPVMIIARTLKGKGIPVAENRNGWHGKPITGPALQEALATLQPAEPMTAPIPPPEKAAPAEPTANSVSEILYDRAAEVATRRAYGNALVRLSKAYPRMVVLDAEVGNSTYAELFGREQPDRFFEMFVAEQNMVGAALGLDSRGKVPFVSTFAAFLTRSFDQIRMAQYSDANIKFCGSHAGVSIGEDGPSQMGLEDIAMFRSLYNSVVLYPSDAVSTEKLVEAALGHFGIVYLRTTRSATPILYDASQSFPVGGCKVLRSDKRDCATIVAAGITVHEALEAARQLAEEDVYVRVIDLYCVKPLDRETLKTAARQTGVVITVEDHYPEGGIGEAVCRALARETVPVYCLAVSKLPKSGTPEKLLDFMGISARALVDRIRSLRG
jgi:transketolase